jgi:hypothetical protein
MHFSRNNTLKIEKRVRDCAGVGFPGFSRTVRPFFERETKLMFEQLNGKHIVVKVYLCKP